MKEIKEFQGFKEIKEKKEKGKGKRQMKIKFFKKLMQE